MDNVVGVKLVGDGKQLEQALAAGGKQVQDFGRTVEKTKDPIDQLAHGLKSAFIGSSVAVGLITLKNRIYDVVQSMVDAQVQVDKLRNGLNFAVGRDKSAGELEFIRSTTASLGLEFISTAAQYTKLAAAARGTTLEGRQTRDVFESIARASTVMGLSVEETQGALLAITQMISKGKVQAEELRGQLGERLPGAFQIAARAMGVTTGELDKMLETGQVLATDFLPKFARQLSQETAPEVDAASKSMQASVNRLSNAWTDLKQNIVQSGLGGIIAQQMSGASFVISGIAEGVKSLSGNNALLEAAQQVNELTRRATILKNGMETGFYPPGFQKELDEVNAKLAIASRRFRELDAARSGNQNPYVSGDDRRTERSARDEQQRKLDRSFLDKLRQSTSGQSATFQADLKSLSSIRERGGFGSDAEYASVVEALIKKEGGVKAAGGGGRVDTAQRLVELRQGAVAAAQELQTTRERLGIERELARLKLQGAGGRDGDYITARRAQLQAQELNAKEAGLVVELAAAKAAESTARKDDDKIQALTKRLGIEKKIEEVQIQRAQLDDGEADFLAALAKSEEAVRQAQAKYLTDRQSAGVAKGLELTQGARDSQIATLPNAQRAQEMLRVESEAMRAIVDVNYRSAADAQVAWDGYYAWFSQRSRELATQFASGPEAGVRAYLDSISDFGKQTADVVTRAFSSMEDALTNFVTTGKLDFASLADSIISDLIRIEIRRNITGPLAEGSSGGGGLLGLVGKIFGGFFAEGGRPPVGKASIVGEEGRPEIFIPDTLGTIVPTSPSGGGRAINLGGGASMVVNIIESPGNGGQQQRRSEGGVDILDVFVEKVKSAVASDIRRGQGDVPDAMSATFGLNRVAGAY